MIEELLKVSIGNLIKERNNMKLLKKYELIKIKNTLNSKENAI